MLNMKNIFFIALLFISFSTAAQLTGGTLYVAAKTGLSIRDKPEVGAKVLDKIPYGTKITVVEYGAENKSIATEGILGYWQKVIYNNKTGYVIDSYLFPWAPPKLAAVKEMKSYLAQITVPFGGKLVTKSGTMNQIDEGGWEIKKQLYKNGAEWHEHLGYEYHSDVFFLPGFTIQKGFLLLRLIPEFKEVFSEKEEFPLESKKYTRGEIEYEVIIQKKQFEDSYPWIEKIRIEYSDGAYYFLEMYMLDNQLVIFYGSGV
jgi:Bacterial SH3 domain